MPTQTLDHDPDERVGRPEEPGYYWIKYAGGGDWFMGKISESLHRDGFNLRLPNGSHERLDRPIYDGAKFVGPIKPPSDA